jgi:hypothetical protein
VAAAITTPLDVVKTRLACTLGAPYGGTVYPLTDSLYRSAPVVVRGYLGRHGLVRHTETVHLLRGAQDKHGCRGAGLLVEAQQLDVGHGQVLLAAILAPHGLARNEIIISMIM